jgi:hypothetical protein
MKSILITVALVCLALPAFAQQAKQQVSFKLPSENIKFTVSQNVDIGDVPNHFVRLFETHGVVPDNALSINGLKIVETISRGVGDVIDGHGGSSSEY